MTTKGRRLALALAVSLAPLSPVALSPAAAQVASEAPPQIDPSQTVRGVVAKYLEFRGPAYLQLQSIHERYYVETQLGRQSGGLWMDRDGHFRREINAGGVRAVSVATPDGAWRSDGTSSAQNDPGASERARRYALVAFGDALTGRGGATVTLAGTAQVMDKSWSVLRVTFGDADAYEALIDPENGLLCCYRITEGGQTRLELFGDWRLVDGVRMPFVQITHTSGDVQAEVGMVELNRPFDPTLFQRPPAMGGSSAGG
jgi:hypothetical protein